MKYFEFSVIFIIIFVIAGPIFFHYRLRKRFFRSYIIRKMAQYCAKYTYNNIFSGALLSDVADLVFKATRNKQEALFKAINSEKFDDLISYISSKNQLLSYMLMSILDIKQGKDILQKYVKQNPKDSLALLLLAFIYEKEFDYVKLRKTLDNLRLCKITKIQKTLTLLLEARIDTLDSDMLSASKKIMLAIKIFKKYNFFYEEAAAYTMLGEIYRISTVFDVSEMMYNSAEKIYLSVDDLIRCSEVKALKGILLIAQERFDQAKELFDESIKVFHKEKMYIREAEVINQKSLMALLQKKYSKALNYANKSLAMHQKYKNIRGESLSNELMALIYYHKKQYDLACNNALLSMKQYLKSKNYSAYQDVAFVYAQSCFSLQEYDKAEQTCRDIIKVDEKHATCFHIASAYSLLGLIYVKTKDYNRATALFKKSLNMEKCNERYSAVATDYANLALINKQFGQLEQAKENLVLAVENARLFQDNQLCSLIEKQIKEINKLLDNK